ncbi:MAG: acyl-CoA dehydrogenase family protein [Chromatocurvus sp.]
MSVIGSTRLSLGEEQAMLLDVARDFCRRQAPMSAVRAQLASPLGFDESLWRQMVELGWTGIALPEAVGGSALGVASVVPVAEALGRAMLGTPLLSTTLAAQLLQRAAPGTQDDLLAEIAAGSVATVALLENEDWGAAPCQVTLDADNRLSGEKVLVWDAQAADIFVVVAADGAGETALAVVRRAALAEGALVPHTLIDETRRAARVDVTGVLAEGVIAGPSVASALHDYRLLGALLVAAEAGGSAASCLDTTVDYLKARKQFGRLIGSYQALKHPAVDILTAVDATRSFVYHAASVVDEGPLARDAEIACRMAKAQGTETLCHAGDRAIQFHGGMGFTYDCDAQLYLRRAQWVQQQFGDAQHHRTHLATLLLD